MAKFFDKLSEKLGDKIDLSGLENLSQKVADAAQAGVDKSKQLAEIAKLRANCVTEEENIKKAYIEIGKLYYAERGDAPEGAYVALCSRISMAKDNIAQNHARIEELKEKPEDDIQEEESFEPEDLADYMPAEEAPAEVAPVAEAVPVEEEAPAEEEPIPVEAPAEEAPAPEDVI